MFEKEAEEIEKEAIKWVKDVFEEYGFDEKEDSGLQPGDSVQYVRQKLYCYFT